MFVRKYNEVYVRLEESRGELRMKRIIDYIKFVKEILKKRWDVVKKSDVKEKIRERKE